MKKYVAMIASAICAVSAVYAAQNYVRDAGQVVYVNPGAAIGAGSLVDVGGRFGVALVDIASNGSGVVRTDGVWKFARGNTNVLTLGQPVYYGSATTVVDGGGSYVGICALAAAAPLTTTGYYVEVELNPTLRGASTNLTIFGSNVAYVLNVVGGVVTNAR